VFNGGVNPAWSPDGQSLYFVTPQGSVSVTIGSGGTVTNKPTVVFDKPFGQSDPIARDYAIAPDGRPLIVEHLSGAQRFRIFGSSPTGIASCPRCVRSTLVNSHFGTARADERQDRDDVAIVTLTRIFKSVFRSLEVNSTPVRIWQGTGEGVLEFLALLHR
jgi:WD40 repeat protein